MVPWDYGRGREAHLTRPDKLGHGEHSHLLRHPSGSTLEHQFLEKELLEILPPTVFFAVGFNLIVLTTDLILADYLVSFASFIAEPLGRWWWESRC